MEKERTGKEKKKKGRGKEDRRKSDERDGEGLGWCNLGERLISGTEGG